MLKHVKGNLIELAFQGEFDVIVHGCNCYNIMGAGIARSIASTFPEAEEADRNTIAGDYNKLGNYTKATMCADVMGSFVIINAYTQYGYDARKSADMFEYLSFELILQKLEHEFPKARFGLPYIGMGLAGGNKDVIMSQIELFASRITSTGGSATLVEFS
jgi:O-acetyl-ADP-ribose deacetylase (regulator of RNase III)